MQHAVYDSSMQQRGEKKRKAFVVRTSPPLLFGWD